MLSFEPPDRRELIDRAYHQVKEALRGLARERSLEPSSEYSTMAALLERGVLTEDEFDALDNFLQASRAYRSVWLPAAVPLAKYLKLARSLEQRLEALRTTPAQVA